jgi:aldehyde dehydrogenase (NAD+)
MTSASDTLLKAMRTFHESGKTIPVKFRKEQLLALRAMIISNQERIFEALRLDLRKSREESWGSEIGLVLMEIDHALKNLAKWARPQRVASNRANIFSASVIHKVPAGVVLIIAPWNYPFQLAIAPLVAAIAAGNCAVVKPSELAPATSALLYDLISVHFPSEYVRVAIGDGAIVVPEMISSFRFDHIFYTGSTATGQKINELAAPSMTPVTLELGGKSPAIIYSDADLRVAARRIVQGKFLNCGQTCIAPDYLLIEKNIYESFVAELISAIKSFYSADARRSDDYGRIINRRHFDRIVSLLEQSDILYGGDHDAAELYISPTVITDPPIEHPLMKHEIFGPILPLIRFSETTEAQNIMNKNPDPLALYLFTGNKKTQQEWIENVRFGGGCINNADWHFTNPNLPFGGVGNSGTGRYHGVFGFDTFSRMKSILNTPLWFDPRIKYPPYKGKLKLLKWLFRG